ncbi:MAG: sugar transferase [Winogradskyella sp.]|uniref:sugar transferase n=1 Tax=Winogradskyella sp. TaxID=1883156 RepID=UPI0017D28043|nr:sugar transferase [Winogradskyella sp.]MBT8243806.1 sugar transferase [Winogradskyella sp.]NNK23414.1 sugar transferase [Winogradskyella sp.]
MFDLTLSFIGLICFGWLIVITAVIAWLDTGLSGFFMQKRVGQHGKLFKVFKLRSMKKVEGVTTTVSTSHDPRITKIGNFWRKSKMDELPQLINVFLGHMSFVGPRPDVEGFADKLIGEDRIILSIKPGITGPASIHYRDEEVILARQKNPEDYNKNVIWPKKVEINKEYIKNYSLLNDIKYIIKTVL